MMSTSEANQQPHLIAGEWRPSEDAATFDRANPFTGEVVTIASAASRADTRAAVDSAAAAFPAWSGLSAKERGA
ncbi:MAG: vanillin dehydrogenase, partial [Nocardioidaceae bacterium]|nr:vanillin dehydrogenase [Nocardioidaceae bacterium]